MITKVAQRLAAVILFVLSVGTEATAQESPELILGRPTNSSVTINALANAGQIYFEYGTSSGGPYPSVTPTATFGGSPINPIKVVLASLSSNQKYYYRARYKPQDADDFQASDEHSFHTQRPQGAAFTFTVQADSHQGYSGFHSASLYAKMFENLLLDDPDFQMDLGDTFSLDGSSETLSTVRQKYLNQREVFATAAHSIPVFLVLGNHEDEEGWNLDDWQFAGGPATRADTLPVLGANARKRYFANPVPNSFYSGNTDASVSEITGDHLKEDYYAFTWGDALFVALDPFWYTTTKPFAGSTGGESTANESVGSRWDWTLGQQQYEWLRTTLENSNAKFKFVFAHHLAGGTEDYSRGGAVGAKYCEWGGYDTNGTTWGFAQRRSDWVLPIHDLMVANGVTIFFHGHDHVFVTEELDGMIYQECPHTSHPTGGTGFFNASSPEYAGSLSGLITNSGHLRVDVSSSQACIDYVRVSADDAINRDVAYNYCRNPDANNAKPVALDDEADTDTNVPIYVDVLDNDTDSNGDSLSVIGVSQPTHGTASVGPSDASVYYEPDSGYCNDSTPDEFKYAIKDGKGGSRVAAVEVLVHCPRDPPNNPPNAVNDPVSTIVNQAITINVVANDEDSDGDLDPSSVVVDGANPSHGTLNNNGNGSFLYTPTVDYVGTDSFKYKVCDQADNCDTATVTITISACSNAGHCSDGNACTIDSCNSGTCSNVAMNCDDGFACTVDSCSGGSCIHTANDATCGSSDACVTRSCSPSAPGHNTQGCVTQTLDCADSNACTNDSCNPSTGCVHATLTCASDGDVCTSDACNVVNGCTYPARTCNDGVACTLDSCVAGGGCTNVPNNGACDDSNPCTVDTCTLSGCRHVAIECDDGNLCTNDACVAGKCVYAPMDCGTDICTESACNPSTGLCGGAPLDCDDDNPCTADSCDDTDGCVNEPMDCPGSTPCSKVSCNSTTGACEADPVDCDDDNPCTADSCDDTDGCQHATITATCDDGEACTTEDQCLDGYCVGFTLDCSELDDECQVGRCFSEDAETCVAVALDDGTECSLGACDSGECRESAGSDGAGGGDAEPLGSGGAGSGGASAGPDVNQDGDNISDAGMSRDDAGGAHQSELDGGSGRDGGPLSPIDDHGGGKARDAGPDSGKADQDPIRGSDKADEPATDGGIETVVAHALPGDAGPSASDAGDPSLTLNSGCTCRTGKPASRSSHSAWLVLGLAALLQQRRIRRQRYSKPKRRLAERLARS